MKAELETGLVQVYTGPGKGKTTAALGLAFRAIGHNLKVCFIQFMKGSSYCGELFSAQRLKPDIDFYQFGRGCPYSSMIRSGYMQCQSCGECFYTEDKHEEFKKYVGWAFSLVKEVSDENRQQLIIMDEISLALKYDLLAVSSLQKLIAEKPKNQELILTGRDMPAAIKKQADLVSVVQSAKHPYQQGITSRRGIEY